MRPGLPASPVRTVEFHRTKYGRELLVDAGFLSRLPGFDFSDGPYRLAFHDILLVTRGRGTFELDGATYRVSPGCVLLTRPGEVRRLRIPALDGACLFFSADFVGETFADPFFLDRFGLFRRDRPDPVLRLSPAQRARYLSLFRRMEREIATLRPDASHALLAQLYDLLVSLDRWYAARHRATVAPSPFDAVERFRRLLERDLARRHRVADYARSVGLSPGHLNALCRRQLGRGAGACIRERLRLEARRLLLYSDLTAAEVGRRLGFEDPAYFSRFFRRETGSSPSEFRSPGGRPRGR